MFDAPPINRRQFYRLRYPAMVRPWLRLRRLVLAVAELSESGARVVVDELSLSCGEHVEGDIRFADGSVFGVVGTVLRHEDGEAILKLQLGIPLRRMLSEQTWVFREFPMMSDAEGVTSADALR